MSGKMHLCVVFDEKGDIMDVEPLEPGYTVPEKPKARKYKGRVTIRDICQKGGETINARVLLTSSGSPDCLYWQIIETPNFYWEICITG